MIKIEYGSVAVGVRESFEPSASYCAEYSNEEDLQNRLDPSLYGGYSNPYGKYSVLLDGKHIPIPSSSDSVEGMGIWTEIPDGYSFPEGRIPSIRMVSDLSHTVSGFSFTFDELNNVFPTEMDVSWYYDGEMIKSKKCYPKGASFFLEENVQGFDEMIVSFLKTNTPNTQIKLFAIEYGFRIDIDGSYAKSISFSQRIDPVSLTLPISSMNLSFYEKSGVSYSFSNGHEIKIFNNDSLIGKYFIDKAQKKNGKVWNISCNDAIGILENMDFDGFVSTKQDAKTVGYALSQIFDRTGISYSVADDIDSDDVVYGMIPNTSKRVALQLLMFSIGAYADTSYSDSVKILKASNSVKETISLDRVFEGQKIEDEEPVTEVTLKYFDYTLKQEKELIYSDDGSETGEKIISFDSPASGFESSGGITITKETPNRLTIDVSGSGNIYAYKYDKSTSEVTKRGRSYGIENKRVITQATIYSPTHINTVAQNIANSLSKTKSVTSRILDVGNDLLVGEKYIVPTQYDGNFEGRSVEQKFNLYGGKVVKEVVIK